jgi:hypothetical protein
MGKGNQCDGESGDYGNGDTNLGHRLSDYPSRPQTVDAHTFIRKTVTLLTRQRVLLIAGR